LIESPTAPEALPLTGAVLVAAGAGLVPLAGALLRHLVPERQGFFARWGFSHLALALMGGILAHVAASALLPGEGVLRALNLTLLTMGGVVLVAIWHARNLTPEGLRAFGFPAALPPEPGAPVRRFNTARAIAAGLSCYAVVVPSIAGLERVWPSLAGWLELPLAPSPLLERLLELRGAHLAWALAVCVLIGPFLEELVFRGFLQPLLVQNFSAKGGVLVTAGLFAALHGAHDFLPLFGLAALLGFLMLRTERLCVPFAVHAAHNALVLLIAFRFPEARELVQ
jgi:membrane protease YdiL (CAAX protease family)